MDQLPGSTSSLGFMILSQVVTRTPRVSEPELFGSLLLKFTVKVLVAHVIRTSKLASREVNLMDLEPTCRGIAMGMKGVVTSF